MWMVSPTLEIYSPVFSNFSDLVYKLPELIKSLCICQILKALLQNVELFQGIPDVSNLMNESSNALFFFYLLFRKKKSI